MQKRNAMTRGVPTFLIFLAAFAIFPSLTLASSDTQNVAKPHNEDSMTDSVWEELVAEVFDKYGNHFGTFGNGHTAEPENDVESNSDEDESQGWWGMLDSIDDEDDKEDDHDIDLEIALGGPELYENISEDAIAFDLGHDTLMIVESDDGGGRTKYFRRAQQSRNDRRARLRQFERRLKSFNIRVLRKGVRAKTCRCRTSSLKGCRRCGGKCCHSIGNGTVECREGSRDSCRRIFGKRSKKRRSSSD